MLNVERHKQIYDWVHTNNSASVNELSRVLGVSPSTVRRDLQEMEDQGLIRRVHGGAVANQLITEAPLGQREIQGAAYKRRIGEAAAGLVRDGESIMITSGTTTHAMLPFLTRRKDLTVITNAINVASYLARHPSITVVVLGGWLRHSELSILGHLTEQSLKDLRVNRVFHGIYGLHAEHGLTGINLQEVQTDRSLIRAGQELVVLADHSKFHRVGTVRLAGVDAVSVVVTDPESPTDQVQALREKGIRVIRA